MFFPNKSLIYLSFHIKLIEEFGLEADRHCLRCLFSSINFNDPTLTSTSPTSSVQHQQQLLQSKLLQLHVEKQLSRASVISNICFAIDSCWPQQKVIFKPLSFPSFYKRTYILLLPSYHIHMPITFYLSSEP